jgi:hypothetical protein
MEQILPTLRRLGDRRCTGRALYLLGQHAHQHGQLARALELLAAVNHEQGHHRQAAVLLGMAHAARESATAHRRPVNPSDETLHHALTETLGVAAEQSTKPASGRPTTTSIN